MRRFLTLIIVLALVAGGQAQQRRTTGNKARTTKTTARKKTTPQKRRTTTKKKATTTKKSGGTTSIKGLQNEQAQVKKQLKQHERKLRQNEAAVKERLKNLMVINTEIEGKRKTIDTIRRDISALDNNITQLDKQIDGLQKQLEDRKDKYVRSMRYMHRNRSIQNQLMFIFSAKSFTQMYRRMRFMREYATYQRVQGEMVKATQAELTEKRDQLASAKQKKHTLLNRGEKERANLESKQTEQKQVVSTLQKEQKTIQQIIDKQRKRDAELNAKIDRLIAEEMEKARKRAEAEARRKAAAEAAAKKRAEELARKKAEAERENARRVAEAKEREARLKAEAKAAENKSAAEKEEANRKAKAAEQERREAERKAENDAKAHEREMAEAKKSSELVYKLDSEDRRISGSFESNRGRLPMPITGPYRIVTHFGQYNVDGLKGVRLDNKGINIQGQAGAQARSIFDGEVSAIFNYGGTAVVMVRHGNYISCYSNIAGVSVHRGQKVKARQALGSLGPDHVLQFQLRREKAKLNPESWLGR